MTKKQRRKGSKFPKAVGQSIKGRNDWSSMSRLASTDRRAMAANATADMS